MSGEKHPIIAHGELYVEPIVKKSRPIDKSIPHEYEDAKRRILSDISDITEKIKLQEEYREYKTPQLPACSSSIRPN